MSNVYLVMTHWPESGCDVVEAIFRTEKKAEQYAANTERSFSSRASEIPKVYISPREVYEM